MGEQQAESISMKLYKFNKDSGEFEEIPTSEIPPEGIKARIHRDKVSSYALFQIDKYIVWLYHGEETSTQVKFMSAREIGRLRDNINLGAKIITVDEGNEPLPFKFATKIADPAEYGVDEGPAVYKPAYTGSDDDVSLIEKMSLERVALLLEQVPTPNGWEREAILHENHLYAVKNVRRRFMGTEIEEIELVPLPKDASIENGTYMAADLNPRMFFENNNLVLVEFLRKTEQRKKQETLFDKFDTKT
nr:hypothetical protein [Candidatus Sigynarchaeota archaeon]